MTPQYIYDIWAPPGAPWSPWVKPVLFAHVSPLAGYADVAPPDRIDTSWAPLADGKYAIVLDLPRALGVWFAIRLARNGFRPVPLYNAVPSPTHNPISGAIAVCDVWPIIAAMSSATPELDGLNLLFTAPPAFMLDSDRRTGGKMPQPGMFDNRSVSLPTDFPSASTMLSRGIDNVILVQASGIAPSTDLAHTLLRWQDAGIRISAVALIEHPVRHEISVTKPRFYQFLWQRLLATIGLRRNPIGGFGGVLPIPSESSGGGFG